MKGSVRPCETPKSCTSKLPRKVWIGQSDVGRRTAIHPCRFWPHESLILPGHLGQLLTLLRFHIWIQNGNCLLWKSCLL